MLVLLFIGDYDKLWQAVSSGRGKGRGGKKKVRPKDVHGEFLKFGNLNSALIISSSKPIFLISMFMLIYMTAFFDTSRIYTIVYPYISH